MTRATSVRIRWTAGKDGEGHAHQGARAVRTLCGKPAIDERNGWPITRRCQECRAASTGELGL